MSDLEDLLREQAPDHDPEDGYRDLFEEYRDLYSPPSPTVLDLDRWGRRRGENLAEFWNEVSPRTSRDGSSQVAHDPSLAADAHGSLFEPEPRLADRPADKHRAAWWKQLLETPEYRDLHAQTCLDDEISELAARSIADRWLSYATENQPPGPGDPEPGSDDEPLDRTLARIRSTSKALSEARETAQEARDVQAGLGMGSPGSRLDRDALAASLRRLRGDRRLAQILAMAGRMRARARSLQRQKVYATRGEITGVELGGDLSRLVASELAQVAGIVPELELLALHRLAGRRSLSYRHHKSEPVQAGPIVVCVDESGSMTGDPIVAAKGLALSMAWLATQQNRWCALVGYSGGTEGNVLVITPGKPRHGELLDWAGHFFGGGTTLDVPVDRVPGWWPEWRDLGLQRGRTDMIMITDAIVSLDEPMRDRYLEWSKAEQVRTYGIVVGAGSAGDLASIADRLWCLPDLALDSAAIEEVLSI